MTTRDGRLYRDGGTFEGKVEGFDPDVPVAGWYRWKLTTGGVDVAVRIWYGPPHDPLTGEEMDRSWRWQAEINGVYAEIYRVWPRCADNLIDEDEARHLMGLQEWGKEAGVAALADPRKKINHLNFPPPF